MNKKERHETDQAIEMTARALGEVDTNSAQPSANGDSASHLEVEFEQVRELGRVIRDSIAHDAERWVSPGDAAWLKDLINAEFVSAKEASTDNTGQMRLAALAATIVLMAGIGYVLVRPPAVESTAIVADTDNGGRAADSISTNRQDDVNNAAANQLPEFNAENGFRGAEVQQQLKRVTDLADGDDASGGSNELGEGDVPKLRDALESNTDAISSSGDRKTAGSGGSDLSEILQILEPATNENLVLEEGKAIIGDGGIRRSIDLVQNPSAPVSGTEYKLEAGPEPNGKFDESKSEFSFYMGVFHESGDAPIVMDPNGTTVPLPKLADSSVASSVAVPDGGTVLLGGIMSTSESRMGDAFLATGDLDIPFTQNSFGAAAPHFGGFGGSGGEYGFRPDVDRDERPSNEQYELPPENQFLKPVLERALSTFSIDVDTASYANIRRFITSGQLPPGNAVRIEEMVNYFSYAYPQPVDGKPFSVSLDVAQCPWQPANKLVRVGIQGRDIPRDNRPASNLVFLIDVSGSMSDQNKLPLLQRSMLMLVDQLTENDRVSIVTYASNAGVRLQPTSGDQKQVIQDVINSLSSGGSTHGSAGITTAYELATQHFIEGGTNRVILATDGDLNVGVTDDDSLVQLIKSKAESGVFLSVLGFGTGNLKDGKLEKIADNGNGQYCYIDSIREAQKVLVAEMSGSLVTIAKDVKLQIEFNPAEVASYRLIGYENRALKNEDFANDRVDAGDIGAGHSVTALYEIVPVRAVNEPAPAPPSGLRYQNSQAVVIEQGPSVDDDALTDAARTGELMNVALRFKQPESNESDLLEVTVKDSNQSFDAAPADFRFAASVAAYGMKLRQSSYAGNWTWSDIENTAVSTISDDPQGHRAELVDLVRQTRRMLGR